MLTEPLVLQIYLSWSSVLFSYKTLPDGYIISHMHTYQLHVLLWIQYM